MFDFRGVKQRLGRHATAQDAQPADFASAFDHGGFQSRGRRGSCRRVTAAAAADDGHVKIKFAHARQDGRGRTKGKFQI
jgi:hypothetical protein